MTYFVILALFALLGIAMVFIILAWQYDHELHNRPTDENCLITGALTVGAILVLVWIAYLMSPILGGR
jgi:hypothetical protein